MTSSDPYNEGPEAAAARRRRNVFLALALVAFVVIVFVVTLVHLGGAGVSRPPVG
jgi:t-SNARE complex subunit (syntaxin)